MAQTGCDFWDLLSRRDVDGAEAVRLVGEATTMMTKGRLAAEQAERLAAGLYRSVTRGWLNRSTVFVG